MIPVASQETELIPGMGYPPPAPSTTWKEEPPYGEKPVRPARADDLKYLVRGIQRAKFIAWMLADGILLIILLEFIRLFLLGGHHG